MHVQAPCLYLRIVFHKCHLNKFNFFNQVGLIALAAFGETLATSNMNPPKTLGKMGLKNEKDEFETQVDEVTRIKVNELEEAKIRAIEKEDFDEAERIKREMLKLKQLSVQMQRLDEKKAIAIQNEDYETAKMCKKDIEKIREAIANNLNGERARGESVSQKPQSRMLNLSHMTKFPLRNSLNEASDGAARRENQY